MTKIGMRRTIPQLPLKRKTPLRAKNDLNKMSEKAKREMKIWLAIKAERIAKLREKFGYIPCEFCLSPIALSQPDAHHNNHNRRQNTLENCRIVHPFCNRIPIEDLNVKDIPSLL